MAAGEVQKRSLLPGSARAMDPDTDVRRRLTFAQGAMDGWRDEMEGWSAWLEVPKYRNVLCSTRSRKALWGERDKDTRNRGVLLSSLDYKTCSGSLFRSDESARLTFIRSI